MKTKQLIILIAIASTALLQSCGIGSSFNQRKYLHLKSLKENESSLDNEYQPTTTGTAPAESASVSTTENVTSQTSLEIDPANTHHNSATQEAAIEQTTTATTYTAVQNQADEAENTRVGASHRSLQSSIFKASRTRQTASQNVSQVDIPPLLIVFMILILIPLALISLYFLLILFTGLMWWITGSGF